MPTGRLVSETIREYQDGSLPLATLTLKPAQLATAHFVIVCKSGGYANTFESLYTFSGFPAIISAIGLLYVDPARSKAIQTSVEGDQSHVSR